jgi:methyl-accepting chemotaxis protein
MTWPRGFPPFRARSGNSTKWWRRSPPVFLIQGQIRQNEVVAEIAAASQEQSSGLSEISNALSQIDQITQSNAASAEETASAAEEMNAQAESMSASVRGLETLVGGGPRASQPPSRTRGQTASAAAGPDCTGQTEPAPRPVAALQPS